jgi:polar amino acid transport system substrate-binding protein
MQLLLDFFLVIGGVLVGRIIFTSLYKPSLRASRVFTLIAGGAIAILFYWTWGKTGMDPIQLAICTSFEQAPACMEKKSKVPTIGPLTPDPNLAAKQSTESGPLAPAITQSSSIPKSSPVTAPTQAPKPVPVYVVGTDAAYAPFEIQNERGDIVGFDIDLLKAIGKHAGFTAKFVNTPWEGIFQALANSDRDIVISAVPITNERKQLMDFSVPYFNAYQVIALAKPSQGVAKFEDLKTLKVGTQTGTTGDEIVTKLLGKTNINIKRFESSVLALNALVSGTVDAVVADNAVVTHYATGNPGSGLIIVVDKLLAREQYGIAVRRGNSELLEKLNSGLAAIKADGIYAAIYARYFGQQQQGK